MKNSIITKTAFCAAIMVITGLSTVGAATIYKEVIGIERPDIVVNFNDEQLNLGNIKGEIVKPILVDNSTYLPVRSIANAVGLKVEWDESNKIINLNKDEKSDIKGEVKEITLGADGMTMVVEGKAGNDSKYEKATVTINRTSIVVKDSEMFPKTMAYGDIKVGDTVDVEFKGGAFSTNPVMGIAKICRVTSAEIISDKLGISGTVKNIVSGKDGITMLVEGKIERAIYDIKMNVTVNRSTNVTLDGGSSNYGEIKVGDLVETTFIGDIMESSPSMAVAGTVNILRQR